jgi:tryptophan 2,3-dioxygenase
VWEAARLSEPPIWQIVNWFESTLALEIKLRACIQHQAAHAQLGERVCGHSPGSTGADDENIVVCFHVR